MNTATIDLCNSLVSAALAMVFTVVLAGSIDDSVGPPSAERPLIQAAAQIDTTVAADRAA
jgi:hypothetical protein